MTTYALRSLVVTDGFLYLHFGILNVQPETVDFASANQDVGGQDGVGNVGAYGVPAGPEPRLLILTPQNLQPFTVSGTMFHSLCMYVCVCVCVCIRTMICST